MLLFQLYLLLRSVIVDILSLTSAEKIKKIFDMFDTDGSGDLDAEEVCCSIVL